MPESIETEELDTKFNICPCITVSDEAVVQGTAYGILASQTLTDSFLIDKLVDALLYIERGFPSNSSLIGEMIGKDKPFSINQGKVMSEVGAEYQISVGIIENVR